jgi:hypothetical protein
MMCKIYLGQAKVYKTVLLHKSSSMNLHKQRNICRPTLQCSVFLSTNTGTQSVYSILCIECVLGPRSC